MPASSSTARIEPPAITPVPGAAGLSSTLAAPTCMLHDVRNGLLDHRHGHEVLLGLLDGFANRFGHFAGFADGKTDLTLAIADDDERAEAKALTALDDLRNAIDAHDGLFESTVVAIATTTIVH